MTKEYLKIPPRPIFIKHETNKLAILTVNNKIYGLSYDNIKNTYDTSILNYDKNYKKAINQFIIQATKNNEKYNNKETFKEITKQRTEYIIKELELAIQNKQSNGHFHKANGLQTATIKEILTENNVNNINKLFTSNNEIETQKALKNKESLDKEKSAKLESLKKEVATNYDNNYIDYAMHKSRHLILNESKNIAKQILMSFMVATKSQSLFNEIHGRADSGKSYIFKVSLDYYIPKEYIIDLNSSTLSAFINRCKDNPHYYDGKILYIGDLGDKETYERMKQIFAVLKIVISEGKYRDSKNQQIGKEWKPLDIKIIGKIGAFYCTVFEDNTDKTKQLDSRAISSTPALNNPNEKILFKEKIKKPGASENAYYTKTEQELQVFKEYFKKLVIKYNKNIHIIINPFLMVFNEITKHRLTETRELENINEMFQAYLIFNHKRCFIFNKTVDNKELVYILPIIEDVQKFINIIYSSVGLKQYEKNLLLKLKKELSITTTDNANKLYKDIEENEDNYKSEYELIKATYKLLLLRNGLNNQTSRKNKDNQTTVENRNYDNKKYFFKTDDIKRKFKSHSSIKDIENLNNTMIDLSDRGFLGKLDKKYNRANVYYLNKEVIEDINEDYNITTQDIDIAINYIEKTFKENPLDPNSKSLFNGREMIKIKNNYKITNLIGLERYD